MAIWVWAMVLVNLTLASGALVITAAAAFAIITSVPAWRMWSKLTTVKNRWIAQLFHAVAVTPLAIVAVLGINYYAASTESFTPVGTEVHKVWSETHYRSKRVSRRTYTRGEPYKMYYAEIELPTGRHKEINITRTQFSRLHAGDSITVNVGRGALGLQVMRYGVRPQVPQSSYRRQFSR